MQALSLDGKPLQLYRFMHSSSDLMELDEKEPHFTTLLIVEKKHSKFRLELRKGAGPATSQLVNVATLEKGSASETLYRWSYYVLPVEPPK